MKRPIDDEATRVVRQRSSAADLPAVNPDEHENSELVELTHMQQFSAHHSAIAAQQHQMQYRIESTTTSSKASGASSPIPQSGSLNSLSSFLIPNHGSSIGPRRDSVDSSYSSIGHRSLSRCSDGGGSAPAVSFRRAMEDVWKDDMEQWVVSARKAAAAGGAGGAAVAAAAAMSRSASLFSSLNSHAAADTAVPMATDGDADVPMRVDSLSESGQLPPHASRDFESYCEVFIADLRDQMPPTRKQEFKARHIKLRDNQIVISKLLFSGPMLDAWVLGKVKFSAPLSYYYRMSLLTLYDKPTLVLFPANSGGDHSVSNSSDPMIVHPPGQGPSHRGAIGSASELSDIPVLPTLYLQARGPASIHDWHAALSVRFNHFVHGSTGVSNPNFGQTQTQTQGHRSSNPRNSESRSSFSSVTRDSVVPEAALCRSHMKWILNAPSKIVAHHLTVMTQQIYRDNIADWITLRGSSSSSSLSTSLTTTQSIGPVSRGGHVQQNNLISELSILSVRLSGLVAALKNGFTDSWPKIIKKFVSISKHLERLDNQMTFRHCVFALDNHFHFGLGFSGAVTHDRAWDSVDKKVRDKFMRFLWQCLDQDSGAHGGVNGSADGGGGGGGGRSSGLGSGSGYGSMNNILLPASPPLDTSSLRASQSERSSKSGHGGGGAGSGSIPDTATGRRNTLGERGEPMMAHFFSAAVSPSRGSGGSLGSSLETHMPSMHRATTPEPSMTLSVGGIEAAPIPKQQRRSSRPPLSPVVSRSGTPLPGGGAGGIVPLLHAKIFTVEDIARQLERIDAQHAEVLRDLVPPELTHLYVRKVLDQLDLIASGLQYDACKDNADHSCAVIDDLLHRVPELSFSDSRSVAAHRSAVASMFRSSVSAPAGRTSI